MQPCSSQKIAKKIRKANRHGWRAYLKSLKAEPLKVRIGVAWWLVFGDKRKV